MHPMLRTPMYRHLCFSLPRIRPLRPAPWSYLSTHRQLSTNSVQKPAEPPLSLVEGNSFAEKTGRPSIRNQVLFFVFGSSLVFSYAAWRTNLETDLCKRRYTSLNHVWNEGAITNLDLRRFQQTEFVKNLRTGYTYLVTEALDVPNLLRPWIGAAYVAVMQPYADAGQGKRLCWKICLLNAGVWVAWKVRRLEPSMMRNFMHNPLSGLSFTLLTSAFSHRSFLHLLFNCLALEGFGSAASGYLLKEQENTSTRLESTPTWHFIAFFTSAGIFASLVSHVVSAKFKYPRMIKELASSSAAAPKATETWAAAVAASAPTAANTAAKRIVGTTTLAPSLGASGAVYACVTMSALAFPEAQIAMAIPPSYPIDIQWGVGGLLCIDMIGALRGWRFMDHWAHLGGAAFGAAYWCYGPRLWNYLRETSSTPQPQKSSAKSVV